MAAARCRIRPMQLFEAVLTLQQMKDAGFSLRQPKEEGFNPRQLNDAGIVMRSKRRQIQ